MRKLEFEFGSLLREFPFLDFGHYIDSFEDTYYLKILWFNFYLTKQNGI